MRPLNRRTLLIGVAALPFIGVGAAQAQTQQASERRFAGSTWRQITDAQWQLRLPEQAYGVLRHEDTERPFTSPLNEEHRRGAFVCAACALELFTSRWKFDSGTGWPSFYSVNRDNIGTKVDRELGYVRTEYHCAQCLGHQGHVFNDGPQPTGLRYCNNGVAIRFIPA